jgi:Phosphate-induced protein 1 conserved region
MKTKFIKLVAITLSLALCALGGTALAQNSTSGKPAANILYHGGEVMHGAVNVYFIWYGCWGLSTCSGSDQVGTVTILNDFINTIGASPYFQINAGYPDATGQAPNNVIYGGATADRYSHGAMLSEPELDAIVADRIASGEFPEDEHGIFVVLTSSDVTVEDPNSHFCITCCTLHRYFQLNGKRFKSVFVGNPARCPNQCGGPFPNEPTPNADPAADGMASWLAFSLNATVTNPYGTAWYDKNGLENSEKCEDVYGRMNRVTNPDGQVALANIHLVQRDFLIQQNWVNSMKPHCAISPWQ